MSKIIIHGGMRAVGIDPGLENLEFEELTEDPVSPGIGRIWINTAEHKLKYVAQLDALDQPVIRSIISIDDLEEFITLLSEHAGNHAPNGPDAIPTAAAIGLSPTSTNQQGVANSLARSDHEHQITGFQPTSIELSKIAALQGGGILKRTAEGDWVLTLLTVADIPNLDFSKITSGLPSTINGYGITDAATLLDLQAMEQTFEDRAANNGFVAQSDTVISFDNATRAFTISPKNADYRYYVRGKHFVRSALLTVTIGNQDGLWFVYFDATGSIQASIEPWDLFLTAPIATVYWNVALAQAQFIGEERHMCVMDPATHEHMHRIEGTCYSGGLVIENYVLDGNGDSNTHAQLSISDGEIQDEDIIISIKHAAAPSGIFEQVLAAPAKLPVMYRSGALWVRDVATNQPVKNVTQRIAYNKVDGVWSAAQADEGAYVAMYIVATNTMTEPVVAVMGQRQDTILDESKRYNDFAKLNWGVSPFSEFKALYRIILQTSSAYSNTVKARIVDIADLRNVATRTISAIPTTNHDALTGLYADDHKQYLHNSVSRQVTAQHTFAPTTPQAPFALGPNATGQLVTGLNAALLEGLPAAAFQSASAQLGELATLTGVGLPKRNLDGSWSLNSLLAGDIPNLDWSKITTGKPSTLAGYGITDAFPTKLIRLFSENIAMMSGSGGIIPLDNTIPLETEGTLVAQKTISPNDEESSFLIQFNGFGDSGQKDRVLILTLFRRIDSGAWTFIGAGSNYFAAANGAATISLQVSDSPTTTGEVTYMFRIGLSGNGSWFLGRTRDVTFGGAIVSNYSIVEYRV